MKKQVKKVTKKGMSTGSKVAIGGAVAAISAVGAGAYLLFGPNGKANQKKALALANKMKKEITIEYKKAKKAGGPVYNKAVDIISKNYAKQYKAHEKDINAIAKKIKSEWKDVEKTVKATTKKVAKVASKKRA